MIGLEKCALFSQPMGIQTNRDLLACVFPRLARDVLDSDWFIILLTSVVISESDNFCFSFTTLD